MESSGDSKDCRMDYYANHCRLCRTTSSLANNWPNVLSAGNEHLLLKIQTCTNVQIHESDKLPKRICEVCQISLNQAHSFRLQCEQANERLRFELNFLEKNDWDTSLPIPSMEYESTSVATNADVKIKTDTPSVATVYIKPELDDDSDSEEKHFPATEHLAIKHDVDDTDHDDHDFDRDSPSPEPKPSKRGGKKAKGKPKKEGGPNKPHQCSVCLKSFRRKCNLAEHAVRHTGVRNVVCTKCDKKFFTETGLKKHMENIHSEDLPYECERCCRGFPNKGQLSNHLSTHLESRDWSCDICSKSFKTKHHLKVHMETHLPKEQRKAKKKQNFFKECVCPYCGKTSTSLTTHNRHILTHTGEQRYECHVCNKRFSTSFSRNNHVRVHSDERPFKCQHCDKAFRQRPHLINHTRSAHTGERPYQCSYCERTFVTRGNKKLHERVHGEPKTSSSVGSFAV